jgi:hypothetical protein
MPTRTLAALLTVAAAITRTIRWLALAALAIPARLPRPHTPRARLAALAVLAGLAAGPVAAGLSAPAPARLAPDALVIPAAPAALDLGQADVHSARLHQARQAVVLLARQARARAARRARQAAILAAQQAAAQAAAQQAAASPPPSPPSSAPAPVPAAGTASGVLSPAQVGAYWVGAGGPSWAEAAAETVAMCESGDNTTAMNPDGAAGLFQILGQVVPGNLLDPAVNAANAVAKFTASGDTWAQWACQP